jgi:hypothetical protein
MLQTLPSTKYSPFWICTEKTCLNLQQSRTLNNLSLIFYKHTQMVNVTLTNIYSSETLQTLLIILTITQTIKHISEMYQN